MFDNTQIQSYKSITAPADLRQKVMTSCESTEKVKKFPVQKTIYGLAPLAACLLLVFSIFMFGKGEPLMLSAGDIPLNNESTTLPYMAQSAAYGIRMASLEPEEYTVAISGNREVEILSADGLAVLAEDGSIQWTVIVPNEDMVYELFLLADGNTYGVFLRYDTKDGSFSIRYEAEK